MKTFSFLFCFLVALSSFAQNDQKHQEELVSQVVQELESTGVDQYMVYTVYCVGENRLILIEGEVCNSSDAYYISYVVWHANGADMIRKVDNCGTYEPLKLAENSLSGFYTSEWPALLDDEVKPYQTPDHKGVPAFRLTPHPCVREITLHKGLRTVNKKFYLFDLSNDSDDGPNRNFSFNHSLKLIELYKRMELIIQDNQFTRQL